MLPWAVAEAELVPRRQSTDAVMQQPAFWSFSGSRFTIVLNFDVTTLVAVWMVMLLVKWIVCWILPFSLRANAGQRLVRTVKTQGPCTYVGMLRNNPVNGQQGEVEVVYLEYI